MSVEAKIGSQMIASTRRLSKAASIVWIAVPGVALCCAVAAAGLQWQRLQALGLHDATEKKLRELGSRLGVQFPE
jgi:hypothetical protein